MTASTATTSTINIKQFAIVACYKFHNKKQPLRRVNKTKV